MKKFKTPTIDWSTTTEVIGVVLVTYGIFLIFPPLSFIALGSFLVWAAEKE
jgi:hypothetical protein